jgi:hypothetical protein
LQPGDDSLSRRRALEDALYLAALEGGADLDGFSVVEQGVLRGETILLRPSSKILDFAILQERKIGGHYEVTVEAFVGDRPIAGCAARPDIVLTAIRPQFVVSQTVPLWMPDALARAHQLTLPILNALEKIQITERDISIQAPVSQSANAQAGFDYQTLLTGRANTAPPAQLPRDTRALQLHWRADAPSSRSTGVDVTLDARIIDTTHPSQNKHLRVTHKVQLAPSTPWRTVNVLGTKDHTAVAQDIAQSFGPALSAWLSPLACAPLVARLEPRGSASFRVALGARDGLTRQTLAFAEGGDSEWTVLRIVELHQSSAVVTPMNTSRASGNLAGTQVYFSAGRR